MKKLLYVVLGIIVIAIISFTIILNLPKASTKNKTANITIEAVQLYSEFKANEAKANKAYIGKIIEVEGVITNMEKDKKGDTVIMLETNDAIASVLCTMENEPKEITIGKKVKIKGRCNGYLMDVVLNRCNLLKS